MTMNELMEQILEILPDAVFEEEMTTGEVVIATGLVDSSNGELKPVETSNE